MVWRKASLLLALLAFLSLACQGSLVDPGGADAVGPGGADGPSGPPGDAPREPGDANPQAPVCVRALTHLVAWAGPGGVLEGHVEVAAVSEGSVVEQLDAASGWLRVATSPPGWARAAGFTAANCSDPATAPIPRPDARKVVVVIFDPLEPGTGRPLHEVMGWRDPDLLVLQLLGFWEEATEGRVIYRVVERFSWPEFPVMTDGFRYDWAGFMAVWNRTAEPHPTNRADYRDIFERSGIVARANAGEAHELWIIAAPYMAFDESSLVGTGGFPYNGEAFDEPALDGLVPVMGLSYERALDCAVEDTAHRTEATMSQVFGGWAENRIAHAWDRFGLVAAQSPDFGYSGCGSAHYPPNGTSDYDYGNPGTAQTMCGDFEDYPSLAADPSSQLEPITCEAWGCSHIGYFAWWFGRMPRAAGVTNGVANDWWTYILDPGRARGCHTYRTEAACNGGVRCVWACGACYVNTVNQTAACSTCGQKHDLPACNAAGGCAWYSCPAGQIQCWTSGTPPATACGQ